MQGLFKSTENHILACLLHLQLHAPLFLYHASAQPPRRHSKNIRGGLARAGASAKQQQGYMSFTVKFIHTCIHTYIQSWKFKLTLFVFLTQLAAGVSEPHRPTTHFEENNTGSFAKKKSFGRRCVRMVAMRPRSCDFFASVFWPCHWSPSRPSF